MNLLWPTERSSLNTKFACTSETEVYCACEYTCIYIVGRSIVNCRPQGGADSHKNLAGNDRWSPGGIVNGAN